MNFGKTFWACFFAVIVASIVSFLFNMMLFFSIMGSLSSGMGDSKGLVNNTVLKISLDKPFSDIRQTDPFEMIDFSTFQINKKICIIDAIDAISKAAFDPCISGIVIDAGKQGLSMISSDHLFELRNALRKFHDESGKFVLSYGDAYSQGGYWLSSIADKIFVNPEGSVDWHGLSGQLMFYKDALDKLGIETQIFRVGKFKSAVEPFMRSEMSEENRLQSTEMLKSIWQTILSDVSESREINSDVLNKFAEDLLIVSPKSALENSMVDSLLYRSDFKDHLAMLVGVEKTDDLSEMDLADYVEQSSSSVRVRASKIAVLVAEGEIVDEVSTSSGVNIVGQDLADEIDKLRSDSTVKAVVMRVNSPGGSALASAVIRNSLLKLKAIKPVVVSMGDYAASGGYWISASADAIVASPVTLTGSIGVFGIIFNLQKTLKQFLGVNVESVATNSNSAMSLLEPLTPVQKAYMQKQVENVYSNFVGLVAEGRNMSTESVDSIAGGRVWSGTDACKIGFVDKLGTVNDAVELAAQKAGLSDYRISVYPKKETDQFTSLFMKSIGTKIRSSLISKNPFSDARKTFEELSSRNGVQALVPFKMEIK